MLAGVIQRRVEASLRLGLLLYLRSASALTAGVLLLLFVGSMFAGVCNGQEPPSLAGEPPAQWKRKRLAEIERRQDSLEPAQKRELADLKARVAWLKNWKPGSLNSKPVAQLGIPKLRVEPSLDPTGRVKRLRKQWEKDQGESKEPVVAELKLALESAPEDPGLLQLYLQWMDDPVRRKGNLKEVGAVAKRLVVLFQETKPNHSETQVAIEFLLYRRGRALAYRELPDVVEQDPIRDPEQLDLEISDAYRDLVEVAGEGRPEFVLLEIRMLRREKMWGLALARLERFGTQIQLKWYLKKRRDLLEELRWEAPASEARTIYAATFPDEVAKEKARGERKLAR